MGRIVFTSLSSYFPARRQVTVPASLFLMTAYSNQYLNGNNALSLMNLLGGGTYKFLHFALALALTLLLKLSSNYCLLTSYQP